MIPNHMISVLVPIGEVFWNTTFDMDHVGSFILAL